MSTEPNNNVWLSRATILHTVGRVLILYVLCTAPNSLPISAVAMTLLAVGMYCKHRSNE